MQMASGQQYEIITIQTSTHLGDAIAGHFDAYADPTKRTYFIRLSPYDDTLSILCMAIYENGQLNTNKSGVLRRRSNGEFATAYATATYACDVVAGDRYLKVVEEV